MKKKSAYINEPPTVAELGEDNANMLIRQLWEQLREFESRLAASSRNSSRSPSSDTPEARAERKKLKSLVVQIRLALNKGIRGIEEHKVN